MREIIAILKKAFFSSIIMTVLLSIMMYLRGYPTEISFVIKYIFPFFFFFPMILVIYFGNYLKKEEKNIANKIKKKRGRNGN